jgi:hypothetical protein
VAWARERLRARLTRRGLTLSAGGLALVLSQGAGTAAVPAPLAGSSAKAALLFAANPAATGAVPARVAALTEGVLRAMWWTRGKLAVAVVLALAAVGTGAGIFMRPGLQGGQAAPPKEEAPKEGQTPFVYALLQIADDGPGPLGHPARRPGPGARDFDTFKKTQLTLVRSRLILRAALARPAVAQLGVVKRMADPVAWLEESLRADFPNDAGILRIGLAGRPEKELAAVVDAVAETYLEEVGQADRKRKAHRLTDLEKICGEAEEKIRKERDQWAKLREARGVGPGMSSVRQQHLLRELTDCTRELRRVKLAHAAARVRLKRARAESADTRKLDEEVAVLTEQERLLADEADRLLARADERERASIELDARRLEIEQAEGFLKGVLAEKEMLLLEVHSSPGLRLLQRAATPPK